MGKNEELPVRKKIDHRGPAYVRVEGAWYFVTMCAEGHAEWVMTKCAGDMVGSAPRDDRGGRGAAALPGDEKIYTTILNEAREYHVRGKWRLALFLVMPDHIHMLVHVPSVDGSGRHGVSTLPGVVHDFKHLLSARYGIRFQRDFFDTRMRDDEMYKEKFTYICKNPVRKGLVDVAWKWPYVIAFNREDGTERHHR